MMCLMPDEEHLAMDVISGNYLILFEGLHEGHCILLLPNGTAPAQQTVQPFKSVAVSVGHQPEVMHEVQEHFKERSSFPATARMEEPLYHLLLLYYHRGPGTQEPLPHPTGSIRAQFSECQRSRLKQARTVGNFENRMWAMYLYCLYTCTACAVNYCKHKNLVESYDHTERQSFY